MPFEGSERKVVHAILHEQGEQPAGYVADTIIAQVAHLPLDEVRDCMETLAGKGLVERTIGVDGHIAYVTAKGRRELRNSPVVGVKEEEVAKGQPKVVPKGLRSFDEGDKDFFLQLLPGPCRNGLPESIHFWKTKIEETDPEKTFKVGVIIGPSGCGKTSLVKAGLLPRLAGHVTAVYVEATSDDTEARLMKGLRKVCPDSAGDLGLADLIDSLHTDKTLPTGRKLVLIIDQFEQWLHARRKETDAPLLDTLRHCDGHHVQAVLMVRDDFSMALHRFLKLLGTKLEEGRNLAFYDLFDLDHSKTVLIKFGQAFGKLTGDLDGLNEDQQEFLRQAIKGLARDGLVVSVQLALFAEMVKKKPWEPRTFKEVGGTEGIGVTFLEETFGARSTNPGHRLHQKAARAVLKALLPEGGTGIKGHMRSHRQLLEVSGYAGRPGEFGDLLGILDGGTRLITPTEPGDPGEGGGEEDQPGEMYYQLTHDYLVPSIREWLTRKQKETRRGRAELLLSDRSAMWAAKPENRHLPSAPEWVRIRLLTRKKDWTVPQGKMMRKAGRAHGLRALGLIVLIAVGIWGGIEGYGNMRASALVESLRTAGTADVPPIVEQLAGYRRWANPRLDRMLKGSEPASKDHLHASLALLTADASQVDYLYDRMLTAGTTELPVLRDALAPYKAKLLPKLWAVAATAKSDDTRLLPAAGALALYDPAKSKWREASSRVSQAMVDVNPVFIATWIESLCPVRQRLTPSLSAIFRDKDRPETERLLATSILADYVKDRPEELAGLLMDAEPKAFGTLFPLVEKQAEKFIPVFRSEINRTPDENTNEEAKDRLAKRQARAAVALVRMGKAEEVWPLLKHSADPRLRSFIANWLSPLGADPKWVVAGFNAIDPGIKPTPVEPPKWMDAILFHPETSQRRALILAIGTYGTGGLSAGEREPLTVKLLDLYRNDPDAGVHGAAEWTLRQWKQQERLEVVDCELMTLEDRGHRRWYMNCQGQTFAVIEGPVEFSMGSPPTEPDHLLSETLHRRRINRRFALATKEVSVEQYQCFVKADQKNDEYDPGDIKKWSPDLHGPQIGTSWYDAAAYCNWLSEQEGLDRSQWCYEPNPEGNYAEGMKIVPDVLERTGYRMPTEAEWEYACRAGAVTSRYYGVSMELLGQYAWYSQNSRDQNSGERAWPCGQAKPNDLGLFDMLGNVYEWCQDPYGKYPAAEKDSSIEDMNKSLIINEKNPRLLRGGTFNYPPADVRSASRGGNAPAYRSTLFGFRPSRTYP